MDGEFPSACATICQAFPILGVCNTRCSGERQKQKQFCASFSPRIVNCCSGVVLKGYFHFAFNCLDVPLPFLTLRRRKLSPWMYPLFPRHSRSDILQQPCVALDLRFLSPSSLLLLHSLRIKKFQVREDATQKNTVQYLPNPCLTKSGHLRLCSVEPPQIALAHAFLCLTFSGANAFCHTLPGIPPLLTAPPMCSEGDRSEY